MTRVKTAKVGISTINITCPYCKGEVEHPESGSLMWEVIAIHNRMYWCNNCDTRFRMPITVKGIRI